MLLPLASNAHLPWFLQALSILPPSIIALAFLYDVLLEITWPKFLSKILRAVARPFTNFLLLDDVSDVNDRTVVKTPPWKNATLLFLPCVVVSSEIALFCFYTASSRKKLATVAIFNVVAWAYAALRVWQKPPVTPPYWLLCFFTFVFISAACEVAVVTFNLGVQVDTSIALEVVRCAISACLVYVIGTFPVKHVRPCRNVASPYHPPSDKNTMPEDSVSLWQWCTFSFVEPIFGAAKTRRLNTEDVWTLSPFFTHKNLFRKYLSYRERYPNRSLIRFLIVSNSLDLIIDIVSELYAASAGFITIYCLQRILAVLSDSSRNMPEAHLYAFVAFLANLSFAQVDLFQMWHSRRCYERARGQLFCALHYKALLRRDLSTGSSQTTETVDSISDSADLGKIVNLMQGDAYTVALRFWQASSVFASTLRLIIALFYLHSVLGWSSMAGVVVVLVAYILNYPLAKYNIYVTRASSKARDARLSAVNELFQNIRFLKFYGWENFWASGVRHRRETELRWRVKENFIAVLISFIWIWVPSAMALFSFLFYTLIAGGRLTVAKTFTALALFSNLQGPMMELPDQFFSFLHAYVSLQRINAFLQEDEIPAWASTLGRSKREESPVANKLGFEDATFQWGSPAKGAPHRRFSLGPLNINFPIGNLSLVTGATGSGKSALLAALLGELYCVDGSVLISKAFHNVAFCAQNPWLEHATIRDNIIFGSQRGFDEARYNAVVEACALLKDLEMFDAGDLTEIGEKGVTLSGGQRARVALARAIYSEARIVLLDDPLAAVDMHTAQHLVDHCFRGELMRDRTIILVTHHISLCAPFAEYLVELEGGQIIRQGSIEELQASGQLKTVVEVEDEIDTSLEVERAVTPENEADSIKSGSTTVHDKPLRKRSGKSGKLVEEEHRAEGRVSLQTYLTYVRAAGWITWLLTFTLMVFMRLLNIVNDLFLAKWSMAYEEGNRPIALLVTAFDRLPPPEENSTPWLLVYTAISLGSAFATLLYISLGYYASLQAARKLFNAMLKRLVRAPSRFFDVTPNGRILNRFTSDIGTIDGALQQSARAALMSGLTFLASFSFILWVVPIFAPFALFIAWLYIRIAPRYIRAARDLRRLESVSLSPAFAGFDELLRGLSHVRAFGMEDRFQETFYKKVDTFQAFDHVYWLVAGWLRWRYDCLGSVVVYASTVFALLLGVSDGFAAIVIVQAGIFAEASRGLVRVAAQLELDFNSVERVGEYLEVAQEAPAIIDEKRPPAYWPSSNGPLIVEDLVVRYAPELPPVLDGVSFTAYPGEKIGVVGRTGSGKTTLALSLLRIIEPSGGKIILDGIDVTSIGLEDLRTRVTIVSQDVSLFTGTIRSNLDPFGEHDDLECFDVLERCHLIHRSGGGMQKRDIADLDSAISPTGSLSAGERQLVALARAILRRSQVIILDEATSQIDVLLDDQIQKTIRQELSRSLVITIAHRLKTIIDYDRIMVLGEGGRIVEMDTPKALFAKGGVFKEMCRRSADWNELRGAVES